MSQQIEELRHRKLEENIRRKDFKLANQSADQDQYTVFVDSWIVTAMFSGMMNKIADNFDKKKAVIKQSRSHLAFIKNVFRMIGKVKMAARRVRVRNAEIKLGYFFNSHCKKWCGERKVRCVKKLVGFLKETQQRPYFMHITSKLVNQVIMI